jgi:hypothetical protein
MGSALSKGAEERREHKFIQFFSNLICGIQFSAFCDLFMPIR